METVLLELGQVIKVHDRDQCIGQWCAIHQPMPGPWSGWPRWWRDDINVMERICPCGIGHPVAEMYEWTITADKEHLLNHGCCMEHQCHAQPATSENTVTIYLPEDRVSPRLADRLNAVNLQKRLLDLVVDLWPDENHATVSLDKGSWNRLRKALLDAYDALEDKQ